MGNAIEDILAERRRQVDEEGWTAEHDNKYTDNELPRAAACYTIGNIGYWPWDLDWWKPTDRRRDLIKAGALIVAEIERLDRIARTSPDARQNAHLIAAAPDLIDALVMALPYVEVCEADPAYKAQHVRNAVKQIRAALAKASPQDNGE